MKAIVKIVTVLAVYKFRHVARICFTVLSSNGSDKYHVCFQGNGRESCDCPSTSKKGCYHLNGLRARAQAYFQQQARDLVGVGKLPQETRQALYNFKQSISGDAMEREYNALRHIDDVPAPEFPGYESSVAVRGSLPGDDGEPY